MITSRKIQKVGCFFVNFVGNKTCRRITSGNILKGFILQEVLFTNVIYAIRISMGKIVFLLTCINTMEM